MGCFFIVKLFECFLLFCLFGLLFVYWFSSYVIFIRINDMGKIKLVCGFFFKECNRFCEDKIVDIKRE